MVETKRSCVLYHPSGRMNVLWVAATDPLIGVDVREDEAAKSFVVTATIPAGYRAREGEKVYIVVKTLDTSPLAKREQSQDDQGLSPMASRQGLVRIPVRVWTKQIRNDGVGYC
jgi:hypothetical protein